MKRPYQIEERKAIQRFRSHLTSDPGSIQLILPLADIAERLRNGVPAELRRILCTTNLIESAFSRVETVCRNVKRWRDGNHRERWIGSALVFVEQKFRRINGCHAMPKLLGILRAYAGESGKTSKIA